MKKIQVSDLSSLQEALSVFDGSYLFRGQTKEHLRDDGSPSLCSSFSRQGCVPFFMLRWSSFAEELLRRGGVDITRPDIIELTQGFLQHYGWRSFFVDMSSSSAVAAWFACHSYTSKPEVHFCEDAEECPVMLRHLSAKYVDHEAAGHLYVMDRDLLIKSGHQLVSLEGELTTDCPSRFLAQKAWLAQPPLREKYISKEAIVAHIVGPSSVFNELAQSAGFTKQDDVFPSPPADKLYENLLGIPWEAVHGMTGIRGYRPSLEIPNYHVSFVKHLPSTKALYSPFWISDKKTPETNELWMHAPEVVFYGDPDDDAISPLLMRYMKKYEVINIESSYLICEPTIQNNMTYSKGISIRHVVDDMYEIGGITVDHPSASFVGWGVSLGYRYRLQENRLVRAPSQEDCPCGDPYRHQKHINALSILGKILQSGEFKEVEHVISVT